MWSSPELGTLNLRCFVRRLCGDTKSAVETSPENLHINSVFISIPGYWIQVVQWMNQLRGSVQREIELWS